MDFVGKKEELQRRKLETNILNFMKRLRSIGISPEPNEFSGGSVLDYLNELTPVFMYKPDIEKALTQKIKKITPKNVSGVYSEEVFKLFNREAGDIHILWQSFGFKDKDLRSGIEFSLQIIEHWKKNIWT